MMFSILRLFIFLTLYAFVQLASAEPAIVYSGHLQNVPGARALQDKLELLGASRYSNFPYVTHVEGHTFVYFSQLKTGKHGGGSIPVVAIRRKDGADWWVETLFEASGDVNSRLLSTIKELGVTKNQPVFLREYVVSGYPHIQLHRLSPAQGKLRAWGPAKFITKESKYLRTAYNDGESWIVEANEALGSWSVRQSRSGRRCAPVAKRHGLSFSEAAVAFVRDGRWVALVREDSGTPRKERALYQAESFDEGCTWTSPIRLGDGTQPDIIRVDVGKTEARLVMCVGDRTSLGLTPELGIQCRASSNVATLTEGQQLRWGAPRMIFRASASGDLGQPQSIEVGQGVLETYFYADRGVGSQTDILYVRYRVSDFIFPKE